VSVNLVARRAFSVAVFARHTDAAGVRRVLLIAHKRLGTWLPVGGEVEAGETPLEAARRELLEETGLHGHFTLVPHVDGAPLGLIGYEEHPAGSKGLHMNFAFVADVDSDQVVGNGEFGAWRFVEDTSDIECPQNVRQLVDMALVDGQSPLVRVAQRWLSRFNARDLDGLLALYADDAVHTSPKLRDRQPETRGEIRGKSALRAWWSDAMHRLPQLRYEPLHLTADASRVIMEYRRVCPPEPELVVAETLVVAHGRIVASHVFHG
jgi:8-oxo-dGTP pyrophosphatase MutT (NUDIX family)/ketosteroid isomerase-like protein